MECDDDREDYRSSERSAVFFDRFLHYLLCNREIFESRDTLFVCFFGRMSFSGEAFWAVARAVALSLTKPEFVEKKFNLRSFQELEFTVC